MSSWQSVEILSPDMGDVIMCCFDILTKVWLAMVLLWHLTVATWLPVDQVGDTPFFSSLFFFSIAKLCSVTEVMELDQDLLELMFYNAIP